MQQLIRELAPGIGSVAEDCLSRHGKSPRDPF
jgi:hypothetical protein